MFSQGVLYYYELIHQMNWTYSSIMLIFLMKWALSFSFIKVYPVFVMEVVSAQNAICDIFRCINWGIASLQILDKHVWICESSITTLLKLKVHQWYDLIDKPSCTYYMSRLMVLIKLWGQEEATHMYIFMRILVDQFIV